MAGILQFDAGEIRIGGMSIRDDPLACKRQMAYIPDNPDLYEYHDGHQVSELHRGHFRRAAPATRQERIRRVRATLSS